MKKIILLNLIISVFCFSLGSSLSFAGTFKDVEKTKYEESVKKLVELEIINGFPDGTFKTENAVTRAQLAKMLVTSLRLENEEIDIEKEKKFSDVDASHWASKYIYIAVKNNLIVGYPEGTFKPEKSVTYAEAVTMMVRALNAEQYVEGAWPNGHMKVAKEMKLLNNLDEIEINNAALRGNVSILMVNSIENSNWKVDYKKEGIKDEKEENSKDDSSKPSGGSSSKPSGGSSSKPSGGSSSKPSGGSSSKPSGGSSSKPSDGNSQKPNDDNSNQNVDNVKPNPEQPSDDIKEPSGDVQKPSGDVQEPSGDVQEPSGDVQEPSGDIQELETKFALVEKVTQNKGSVYVTISGKEYEVDLESVNDVTLTYADIKYYVDSIITFTEDENVITIKYNYTTADLDDADVVTDVEDDFVTFNDDKVIDITLEKVVEEYKNYTFVKASVYADKDNILVFEADVEELGKGIENATIGKGDRVIFDEDNDVVLIIEGLEYDAQIEDGRLIEIVSEDFYLITSDGSWYTSSSTGKDYHIVLSNISGDEIFDFATEKLGNKFAESLYKTGEISFVWAGFNSINEIEKLEKISAGKQYGSYIVEEFTAEIDEDNYLNNSGNSKVINSTNTFTVSVNIDENGNTVGYELKVSTGVDSLIGIEEGLVAYSNINQVNDAKYVFVKGREPEMQYGLIQKVTQQRGIVYATIEDNEYEVNNLLYEEIRELLDQIVVYEAENNKITVKGAYVTGDLDEAWIITDVVYEVILVDKDFVIDGKKFTKTLDVYEQKLASIFENYTFIRTEVFVDRSYNLVFEDLEVIGKGVSTIGFKKGERLLVDETNKVILIASGLEVDDVTNDGKLSVLKEGFYVITSDGSWSLASEEGKSYHITLANVSGDEETYDFASKTYAELYENGIFASGDPVFVWAKFNEKDKIEELHKLVSGEVYGDYTIERFSAELDDDNYLNNPTGSKVTAATVVFTVTPVEDEDDIVVGFEVEVSQGAEALDGVTDGFVAYETKTTDKRAKFVFVAKDVRSQDLNFGLVEKVTQNRGIVYATISGTEYKVELEPAKDVTLTYADIKAYVDSIIAFTKDEDVITIKFNYTTADLDDSDVVTDVNDDLVTFNDNTTIDTTLNAVLEEYEDYTFIKASVYADKENILVFEADVEELGKGIENATMRKGDRVIFDEDNDLVLIVEGLEYDDQTEDGRLILIVSEDFYVITSDGSWYTASSAGKDYHIVLSNISGDEIFDFATESLGNEFVENLYATGDISFVWAGFNSINEIEKLEKISSGKQYGSYIVEEFTAEIDEDNYLNNSGNSKVINLTNIFTVFVNTDENGNTVGYELKVSTGADSLMGIDEGLVAYSNINQVNDAKYVFVKGREPEMQYGLVQKAMQQRGIVYAIIDDNEYEVEDLTFEEIRELVDQIVIFELRDNKITIKDAYSTTALDNSYIVMDVDDEFITFNKVIVIEENQLAATIDISLDKNINLMKEFIFIKVSAYADSNNLIMFEPDIEILGKGLETATFEKGDRVIIDEENNTIIIISGFEYDDILMNGELVNILE